MCHRDRRDQFGNSRSDSHKRILTLLCCHLLYGHLSSKKHLLLAISIQIDVFCIFSLCTKSTIQRVNFLLLHILRKMATNQYPQ
ncbi:hypothetical protein FGO68_gene3404 [Halteria grandinella]|uniref:Uncharacterized protein n=1 Tax=Halteria grandinella TaxID=5974 RepID=A0A8J8NNT8_HALGN|nr:hypothetical protein FGO68_gene3404 [Halteria grandinella]